MLFRLFILSFFFLTVVFPQNRTVSGTITNGVEPLTGISIINETTNQSTSTDKLGKFIINVDTGNILRINALGYIEDKYYIEDNTQFLRIVLKTKINELEGVTVTGSKRRKRQKLEKEYNKNKQVIRTSYGYLDKKMVGGTVHMIHKDEIGLANLCILDILRRVPGIRVSGDCIRGGSVNVRGAGSINLSREPLFDVDGLLMKDVPLWIHPSHINRIAVLSTLSMTSAYGTNGNGGVIIINTENLALNDLEVNKSDKLLNKNFFSNDTIPAERLNDLRPYYYLNIKKIEDSVEAFQYVKTLANKYSNSPNFLLNIFELFGNKWNSMAYCYHLMKASSKKFEDDPTYLKSLAFLFEKNNLHNKALEVYKKLFKLRPKHPQSYLNLIHIYEKLGYNKKSKNLILRLELLKEQNMLLLDSIYFNDFYKREMFGLLGDYSLRNLKEEERKYSDRIHRSFYNQKRLVFEWSCSDAEFIIQFVNPSGQYYEWKHVRDDTLDLIFREKKYGFNTKDFFLDNKMVGEWKINVKYLGNITDDNVYLKVTVIDNFGKIGPKDKTKIINLFAKDINQNLLKIKV
ncbi:MAG: carboxypeptidase-like regulatory domain-containing protein [Bacteroidota bacterium]